MSAGRDRSPLLVVHAAQVASPFGQFDEFSDPKAIALAAEGFCPYCRNEDDPPRLVVQADGSLICPHQPGNPMRFEFIEEKM